MYRSLLTFAALMIALPTLLHAEGWSVQRDLDLELRYDVGYDNNILELSEDDLDRYEIDQLRAHDDLETYDDLINTVSLRTRITSPEFLDWRNLRLYYTIGYQSYLRNPHADRVTHSLFFTQDLVKYWDILGGYFIIPERYLRDYYDRDWGEYYSCDFSYHLYSIGIRGKPFDRLQIEARYEGYQVYYNEYFTEYDTESVGFRAGLEYEINHKLEASLELRRRWADNTGFEQSDFIAPNLENPDEDAEYGDGSYGEEWIEAGIRWQTPKLLDRSWDTRLSYRMRHRFYTSELSLEEDPFHAGREHWHQRLMLSTEVDVTKRFAVGPEIEYEWRRTESPAERVADIKDFNTYRFWLHLSYEIW
ncbi:hypothetical protein GF324_08710 [bacterium]|nr:hypothetical protein [bacterium]